MAVFKTAVADAFAVYAPSLYDSLDGFGCADGGFGEAIDCEGSATDGEIGDLFDLKVLGDTAKFHGSGIQGAAAGCGCGFLGRKPTQRAISMETQKIQNSGVR